MGVTHFSAEDGLLLEKLPKVKVIANSQREGRPFGSLILM